MAYSDLDKIVFEGRRQVAKLYGYDMKMVVDDGDKIEIHRVMEDGSVSKWQMSTVLELNAFMAGHLWGLTWDQTEYYKNKKLEWEKPND